MTGHLEREVAASQLREECFALLDEVARTKVPLLVTRDGRPVARVVPIADTIHSAMGSVALLAREDAAYYSTGVSWDT